MDSAVDIRVAGARERQKQTFNEEIDNLVCPGDVITTDTGFMRYDNLLFVFGSRHTVTGTYSYSPGFYGTAVLNV